MINILLIGLGSHARRIQLPTALKDGQLYGASIKAVADLKSQQSIIETYFKNKTIDQSSFEVVYLDSDLARLESGELSIKLVAKLDELVTKHSINAVFISTEPARHVPYAKWALRKSLNIFMDKPISEPFGLASSNAAVDQISRDYLELAEMYKQQKKLHPNLVFELMAQRRYHPAFHKIDQLIQEVKEHTGTRTPITSFQSLHSDGQWRMPDEIVD